VYLFFVSVKFLKTDKIFSERSYAVHRQLLGARVGARTPAAAAVQLINYPPSAGSRRQHISGLPVVSGHRLNFTNDGKYRSKNQYCVAWSRSEATRSSGAMLFCIGRRWALGYLKTTPWIAWNPRCHS